MYPSPLPFEPPSQLSPPSSRSSHSTELSSLCFFFFFFLVEGLLLYNLELVSAIHPHESAMGKQVSPAFCLPPPTPPHPSRSSQSTELSASCHRANCHCLFYTWWCTHFHVAVSIPPTPSFLPLSPLTHRQPCPRVCSPCLPLTTFNSLISEVSVVSDSLWPHGL